MLTLVTVTQSLVQMILKRYKHLQTVS